MITKKFLGFSDDETEILLLDESLDIEEGDFWETLLERDPNPMLLLEQRHQIRQCLMEFQGYLDAQIDSHKSAKREYQHIKRIKRSD